MSQQKTETCEKFRSPDGRRGKPALAAPCGACGVAWSDHAPRGSSTAPQAKRKIHLRLTPKARAVVVAQAQTPPKPVIVAQVQTPPKPSNPWGVEEPHPAKPSRAVRAEPEAQDDEHDGPGEGFLSWLAEQEEEQIDAYIAQGMTRAQAQAQVEADNDW